MDKVIYKRIYQVILIGAILIVFGLRFYFGFVLGSGIALVILKGNDVFWNGVLDTRTSHKYTGVGHWLKNYGLMIVGLLICVFFPNVFNIFTCALGMMIVKWATLFDEIIRR